MNRRHGGGCCGVVVFFHLMDGRSPLILVVRFHLT